MPANITITKQSDADYNNKAVHCIDLLAAEFCACYPQNRCVGYSKVVFIPFNTAMC